MNEVDSTPSPRHENRRGAPAGWEQRETNRRAVLALIIGLGGLLFALIVQALDGPVSHMFLAGLWRAVSPWLTGIGVVTFVICAAIVGWRLYQVKLAHDLVQLERSQRQMRSKLMEENYTVTRQTSLLLQEARTNGDNVKLTYDGEQLKSVEIVRSAVLLGQAQIQEQARIQEALAARYQLQLEREQREERKQIAAPAGWQPQQRERAPQSSPQGELGPAVPRRIAVPGPYDMIDALRRFPLSEEAIFLSVDSDRQVLRCDPSLQLCHGALNAVTGRGKTILIRGVETQLLKVGFEVVHADIKFALVDEKGNDYRPIARALLSQPDMNVGGVMLPHLLLREEHIVHFLRWLAGPELLRRLALYHRGQHTYKTFFLFLEELLYLIGKYKELGPLLSPLLSVGRSLGIKVFCVAQNFQVQNLKLNSGMRENFESAWFLGGDLNSGAALLDMSIKGLQDLLRENNIQLGKGVSLFRNNEVAYDARVVRSGMASNEFVYWMLGKADTFQLPDEILPAIDADPSSDGELWVPHDVSAASSPESSSGLPLDEDLREALEAYRQGASGPRALERALGCTYYQAQKMWGELKEKGLVEAD